MIESSTKKENAVSHPMIAFVSFYNSNKGIHYLRLIGICYSFLRIGSTATTLSPPPSPTYSISASISVFAWVLFLHFFTYANTVLEKTTTRLAGLGWWREAVKWN